MSELGSQCDIIVSHQIDIKPMSKLIARERGGSDVILDHETLSKLT